MIALRAGVPVLPVFIRVKNNKMRHFCKKEIIFGKPITIEEMNYNPDAPGETGGHATLLETSLMMALTDSVDLEKLPPKGVPLMNTDWGITDGLTYAGKNTKGYVLADPRNATAKIGQKCEHQPAIMLQNVTSI